MTTESAFPYGTEYFSIKYRTVSVNLHHHLPAREVVRLLREVSREVIARMNREDKDR